MIIQASRWAAWYFWKCGRPRCRHCALAPRCSLGQTSSQTTPSDSASKILLAQVLGLSFSAQAIKVGGMLRREARLKRPLGLLTSGDGESLPPTAHGLLSSRDAITVNPRRSSRAHRFPLSRGLGCSWAWCKIRFAYLKYLPGFEPEDAERHCPGSSAKPMIFDIGSLRPPLTSESRKLAASEFVCGAAAGGRRNSPR
jgi:hypothetical protein